MRIWSTVMALALLAACSSKKDKGKPEPAPSPTQDPDPVRPEAVPAKGPEALPEGNQPPHFQMPAWTVVGVGQHISFSTAPIDDEADEIRVAVVQKPESATYDPVTLTVAWTPTRADMPRGRFVVRITEVQRDGGQQRVFDHAFAIDVTREEQPRPHARPLSDVVELLLTIHDPERLAAVNREWPFARMLQRAAELEWEKLAPDKQATVTRPDGASLYRDFLKAMAKLHGQPKIDPDAPEFDKRYADPSGFEIVTVRPRLDKQWHELRVAYRHRTADEEVLPMFRFLLVKGGPTEAEGKEHNNRVLLQLAASAFFTDEGDLKPEHIADKAAHGRAVAAFVTSVLAYSDAEKPWARGHFAAMPHGARLGGGSKRNPDGSYASGDGWAWGAMRPLYYTGAPALKFENVGFPGFVAHVIPDGQRWKDACGPLFDPKEPGHPPGWEALCLDGGVGLPGTKDGKLVRADIDAVNLYLEHKEVHTVATLPLRDPRRDPFEEKGTTCSQCHVRDFGVRDFYDQGAIDPSKGKPAHANKRLPPTFFVVIPLERWEPYAIDFQYLQECLTRDHFEKYLGRRMKLSCPQKAG